MKINEAMEKMRAIVEDAMTGFAGLGLILDTECFYSTATLAPTEPEKAKYLNITLIIKATPDDEESETAEHRVGIGVEVKWGSVGEKQLEEAESDFRERLGVALCALRESEDKEATVAELDRAATEEYEALVAKIQKTAPKIMLGIVLVSVVAIILIVMATFL